MWRPTWSRERRRLRLRPTPLSARLVITYALLVAATLLVVDGLVVHLTRSHLNRQLDRQITSRAESFQTSVGRKVFTAEQLGTAARGWLRVQGLPADQFAAVRTDSGEVLTSAGGLELYEVPRWRTIITSERSQWWDLEGRTGRIRVLTQPLVLGGRSVGTLAIGGSLRGTDAALGSLLSGVGLATLVGLAFASIAGLLAVRRTLRPLEAMSRGVELIQATGDLSQRLSTEGPQDEVGRLAVAFDRMLSRLEESFKSQRRFLSDASHELKTPLTVVRGQIELLSSEIRNPEGERSQRLALEELDRMRRIVEGLLLLARLDEGMPMMSRPVEVELLLREALLRAMLVGRRSTSVVVTPGLFALGDPDRLLQVFTNLVTNAVEHAGEGASLRLRAFGDGERVLIEVSDNGKGIPAAALDHVFERFYRGAQARSRPGGAGLGLAIAASLVRSMGGSISVESAEGRGTTFRVWLRAAPSAFDRPPTTPGEPAHAGPESFG